MWCSHINYLGDDLACVTISLSPTEELATKAASYARPTITAVWLYHQNFSEADLSPLKDNNLCEKMSARTFIVPQFQCRNLLPPDPPWEAGLAGNGKNLGV